MVLVWQDEGRELSSRGCPCGVRRAVPMPVEDESKLHAYASERVMVLLRCVCLQLCARMRASVHVYVCVLQSFLLYLPDSSFKAGTVQYSTVR